MLVNDVTTGDVDRSFVRDFQRLVTDDVAVASCDFRWLVAGDMTVTLCNFNARTKFAGRGEKVAIFEYERLIRNK